MSNIENQLIQLMLDIPDSSEEIETDIEERWLKSESLECNIDKNTGIITNDWD